MGQKRNFSTTYTKLPLSRESLPLLLQLQGHKEMEKQFKKKIHCLMDHQVLRPCRRKSKHKTRPVLPRQGTENKTKTINTTASFATHLKSAVNLPPGQGRCSQTSGLSARSELSSPLCPLVSPAHRHGRACGQTPGGDGGTCARTGRGGENCEEDGSARGRGRRCGPGQGGFSDAPPRRRSAPAREEVPTRQGEERVLAGRYLRRESLLLVILPGQHPPQLLHVTGGGRTAPSRAAPRPWGRDGDGTEPHRTALACRAAAPTGSDVHSQAASPAPGVSGPARPLARGPCACALALGGASGAGPRGRLPEIGRAHV